MSWRAGAPASTKQSTEVATSALWRGGLAWFRARLLSLHARLVHRLMGDERGRTSFVVCRAGLLKGASILAFGHARLVEGRQGLLAGTAVLLAKIARFVTRRERFDMNRIEVILACR